MFTMNYMVDQEFFVVGLLFFLCLGRITEVEYWQGLLVIRGPSTEHPSVVTVLG